MPVAQLAVFRWLRGAAPALVSFGLIALAWQPGLYAPYQYDDFVTPLKDPASQSLTHWVQSLPQTLRPLTKLSYAIESSLGAHAASSRRVFQGTLLLLSAWLVAQLARTSGLTRAAALALATLWAVHPVHGESVIALAGRSVLLSLCLSLASAIALTRTPGRPALALGLAVFAVLARETAWPWLVVCAGWLATGTGAAEATPSQRRVRLAGAALAASLLGGLLVLSSSRLRTLLAFSFADPAAFDRLGLQWAALPRGVLMWLFQPMAFSVDIDFAPRGALRLLYLGAAVLLYAAFGWLAITGARGRAREPTRILALLWLCLVLPLHSVVPKLDPLTARSVSASSAALVGLAAAGLAWLFARPTLAARAPVGTHRRSDWVFWPTMGLLLLGLVPITRERASLYRDPITLWRDAALRSEHNVRPWVNLGTLLAQKGQLVEARAVLQAALRRHGDSRELRERAAAVDALIETRSLLEHPEPEGTEPQHETDLR
jgi:hypothetical protein